MSDPFNQIYNPIKDETIKEVELLDLPIFKKHHLRLLIHCLEVFKVIAVRAESENFPTEESLLSWCQSQAESFDDEEFILYWWNRYKFF